MKKIKDYLIKNKGNIINFVLALTVFFIVLIVLELFPERKCIRYAYTNAICNEYELLDGKYVCKDLSYGTKYCAETKYK